MLSDLAARQRMDGNWVENAGVVVLHSALYLARDIEVHSQTSDTEEVYLTRIDGRGESAKEQPLTVFFRSRHY